MGNRVSGRGLRDRRVADRRLGYCPRFRHSDFWRTLREGHRATLAGPEINRCRRQAARQSAHAWDGLTLDPTGQPTNNRPRGHAGTTDLSWGRA